MHQFFYKQFKPETSSAMSQPAAQLSHQQPWFLGAPATKIALLSLLFVHVLFHSKGKSDEIASQQHGFERFHWTDFITSKVLYGSTGEFILGFIALFPQLRRLEREFGSTKFVSFLLFLNAFTLAAEVVGMVIVDATPARFSGPYPWIGGALVMYAKFTPRLHPRAVSILGFSFSEKSFSVLFCSYIVAYRGLSTIVPTILGALGATIFLILPPFDIPSSVVQPLESIASIVINPPPKIYAPLIQAHQRQGGREQRVRVPDQPRRPAPTAPPAPTPPSEEAIQQLTSMGFERDQVVRALELNNNNIERAADRLLSGS